MKVSRIVAKIVIRLFFILLLVALVPYFMGDHTKFQHIYFTFHHWWEMIFPAVLILCFIGLLIICVLKKYSEEDLNWLLVVNAIVLTAYGIAIYIRVYHMVA